MTEMLFVKGDNVVENLAATTAHPAFRKWRTDTGGRRRADWNMTIGTEFTQTLR